ncbi:MAG: DNA repair protein RecN [Chloroflexota bacterium]|jgi:DNA repair protein RecN (Recombination protein N)
MLHELSISNFAIIEQITLRLQPGFTVLSGETGAGKSIIIDALGMLRGDRFDASYIRSGADKARIEGVFYAPNATHIHELLDAQGLIDEDDEASIIIMREINRDTGRSISRINGRAVNTTVLREIGSALIDIQGQHDGMAIFNSKTHLDMLDRFGQLGALRTHLGEQVQQLKQVQQQLADLTQASKRRDQRIQELRQILDDVSAAKLRIGEEEELLQERSRFQNGARITELITQAYNYLNGDERRGRALVETSALLNQALADLHRFDSSIQPILDQSTEVQFALEELLRTVRGYRDSVDFDPQRIEHIEDRITVIRDIQRKYRLSVAELIAQAQQANEEIDQLEHSDVSLAQLQHQVEILRNHVSSLAQDLSLKRHDAAQRLAHAVQLSAKDLAMPHVRFVVQQQHVASSALDGIPWSADDASPSYVQCDKSGADKIEFLLSPNPGEDLKPLAKIASGGEGSRLFLAIKSILSQVEIVGTVVFDEIDTGVGGRAGLVVGEKLWQISRTHQVLCISHLAQVASFGDQHFAISKDVNEMRTLTRVIELNPQSRVDELAAMLDGHPISDQSRSVAQDMLSRAQTIKQA